MEEHSFTSVGRLERTSSRNAGPEGRLLALLRAVHGLPRPNPDEMSGRVMEYSWQTLFTGLAEVCPIMNQCYCDGYGVCFGGKPQFDQWFEMRERQRKMGRDAVTLFDGGKVEEAKKLDIEQAMLQEEPDALKAEAFVRGSDPKNRTSECGRPRKEGDGF